jgi:hypothetical protein
MVCRAEYLSDQQVRGPWPAQCWQRLAAISWPLDSRQNLRLAAISHETAKAWCAEFWNGFQNSAPSATAANPWGSLARPCSVAPAKGCHCKGFAAAATLRVGRYAISWPLDQIGLMAILDRFSELGKPLALTTKRLLPGVANLRQLSKIRHPARPIRTPGAASSTLTCGASPAILSVSVCWPARYWGRRCAPL